MADAFRVFQFGERQLVCDGNVHLRDVVNVTPDSFSDGCCFAKADAAVARRLELVAPEADATAFSP